MKAVPSYFIVYIVFWKIPWMLQFPLWGNMKVLQYYSTLQVFKIHGVGPRQVADNMMDNYFKYNSGGKKFSQIHTKHLTATIDAFTIHNSLWLGKKTRLPDKDMALVV